MRQKCPGASDSRTYAHYVAFEAIPANRAVAQTVAIRVDCVEREIQYLGNAVVVLYAKPDKRENTEVGIEHLVRFKGDTALGAEKLVHILHKVGIYVQEGIVENFVELLALFVNEFTGTCHTQKIVGLPGGNLAHDNLVELTQFVHIYGRQVEKLAYIYFLGIIGVAKTVLKPPHFHHLLAQDHQGEEKNAKKHHKADHEPVERTPAFGKAAAVGMFDNGKTARCLHHSQWRAAGYGLLQRRRQIVVGARDMAIGIQGVAKFLQRGYLSCGGYDIGYSRKSEIL